MLNIKHFSPTRYPKRVKIALEIYNEVIIFYEMASSDPVCIIYFHFSFKFSRNVLETQMLNFKHLWFSVALRSFDMSSWKVLSKIFSRAYLLSLILLNSGWKTGSRYQSWEIFKVNGTLRHHFCAEMSWKSIFSRIMTKRTSVIGIFH